MFAKTKFAHFDLNCVKNVVDLRFSGSPFHIVVGTYVNDLNECKPS